MSIPSIAEQLGHRVALPSLLSQLAAFPAAKPRSLPGRKRIGPTMRKVLDFLEDGRMRECKTIAAHIGSEVDNTRHTLRCCIEYGLVRRVSEVRRGCTLVPFYQAVPHDDE